MMPHVPGSFDSTAEAASPVAASAEIATALANGTPVVALESTLLAHGLPAPRNRTVADELEAAVRAHGAVPATVAVLDGGARVGLSPAELDHVCGGGLAKLSVRDLGVAVGLRRDGATTVAATAALAAAAGIAVFATGGLGGVHREARESWDVSDELDAALHDRLLAEGLDLLAARGVRGKDVTPALLQHFHAASAGASMATNLALVRANAELAARVAVALAR